ncbi:MAG: Ig-like domain-containing protein [Aeromonas veronii]
MSLFFVTLLPHILIKIKSQPFGLFRFILLIISIFITSSCNQPQASLENKARLTSINISVALVGSHTSKAHIDVVKGGSAVFSATGHYSDMTTRDISQQVVWKSSNPAVGGGDDIFIGLQLGLATVTAEQDGVVSSAIDVNVTPAVITSIQVTPATFSVAKGASQQLTAIATLSDGSPMDVTASVTWQVGDTGVATLSSTGLLTGMQVGNTTITAQQDGGTSNTVEVEVHQTKIKYQHYDNVASAVTSIKMTPRKMITERADVKDSTELEYTSFRFDDVVFFKRNGDWFVNNRTPFKIRSIVVIADVVNVVKLKFEGDIEPFTRNRIELSNDMSGFSSIRSGYQARSFLPEVKVKTTTSPVDCSNITVMCRRYASSDELPYMLDIISNIHSAFNETRWLNQYNEMMSSNCLIASSFTDCAIATKLETTPDILKYKDRVFLQYGMEGHKLDWQVFGNVYEAEGWGSGSTPSINNKQSLSSGYTMQKDLYITPTSNQFNRRRTGVYRTGTHEIGHAFGFGHASGMSYGLGDVFEKYIIKKPSAWLENRSYMPEPELFIHQTSTNNDLKVRFEIYQTSNADSSRPITIEMISMRPLTYVLSHDDNDNTDWVELSFKEFPIAPTLTNNNVNVDMGTVLYTRVYDQSVSDGIYSTVKINAYDFLKARETGFEFDSSRTAAIFLSDSYQNMTGQEIRRICYSKYGYLATEADYKRLWGDLKFQDLLSTLPVKRFLSITEPRAYYQYVVKLESDYSLTERRVTSKIGRGLGFVCLLPRNELSLTIPPNS